MGSTHCCARRTPGLPVVRLPGCGRPVVAAPLEAWESSSSRNPAGRCPRTSVRGTRSRTPGRCTPRPLILWCPAIRGMDKLSYTPSGPGAPWFPRNKRKWMCDDCDEALHTASRRGRHSNNLLPAEPGPEATPRASEASLARRRVRMPGSMISSSSYGQARLAKEVWDYERYAGHRIYGGGPRRQRQDVRLLSRYRYTCSEWFPALRVVLAGRPEHLLDNRLKAFASDVRAASVSPCSSSRCPRCNVVSPGTRSTWMIRTVAGSAIRSRPAVAPGQAGPVVPWVSPPIAWASHPQPGGLAKPGPGQEEVRDAMLRYR